MSIGQLPDPPHGKVGPNENGAEPFLSSEETVVSAAPTGARGESESTGAEPAIGDLISGRYRLEKILGEGGMGKVFLAQDELYGHEYKDRQAQVALKFLTRTFAGHSISRMALQRETRKSQQLTHPNVVRVHNFDHHAGNPYMIMEYMRGQSLDDFLRANAANGLPLKDAFKLIQGMVDGLGYIHGAGLVHSDFKPNNVFVGADGEAKILDLGIARINEAAVKNDQETQFNASALGALTPTYASCEMFEGQPPDPRDDIYALGCVIYELLAGHHPFNRVPALQARANAMKPKRLEQLSRSRWHALEQSLAFNRVDRTSSTAILWDGLQGDKRRRKLVLAGLAVVTGLAVLAAVSLGLLAMKPEDPNQVFMNKLGALAAQANTLTAADPARIQRWLAQGNTYLEVAEDVFEQGDLLSAHQVLVEGADNAQGAFMSSS